MASSTWVKGKQHCSSVGIRCKYLIPPSSGMCSTTVSLLATILYGTFQLHVSVWECVFLCVHVHMCMQMDVQIFAHECGGKSTASVFSQTASFLNYYYCYYYHFFVCMCVCRGLNMIWFLTATVKGICEPDHSNPHSCLRSTQPQSHFSGFFFKHGFRGLSMCPCACKASTLLTHQNKYTIFEDGRSYI